ncbi:helix-turn-helix transcriptional regulator [Granulicoccus phenolivorans]|uniref:helix-turn-helix transcriptional regulator n=1 Tax=Granulicoccus phenolivorans TaxID=266854 RepID=UPI0003FCF40D|nr:helix-turn-helix transcriptional regulator [Granulicoccus phenolivorans]
MAARVSPDRVAAMIRARCRAGLDGRELRIAVIEDLRRVLAFDQYVWVLTDPLTWVGVDPLADVPGVRDLARTIRLKYATAVNRWTTLSDVAGLGERAAESPLWREVQRPLGVVDVASVVFRDAYGCWGFLDLWLPEPLDPAYLRLLHSVEPELTGALRAARAATLRILPAGPLIPTGPATLVLADTLAVQGSTAGMADRLQRLLPGAPGMSPVPAAALNAAAQLLAVEDGVDAHPAEARTHLGEGRWVVVRAARLDPPDPSAPAGRISVAIEPVTPAERLDLCVRAFGCTPREAAIVRLVARGLDTASIAGELHLAAYTVQDHLKAIFTKAQVASRRDLVPLLAG